MRCRGRVIMSLVRSFSVTLVLFLVAGGAELYARKMEVVRTTAGQATVFRDGVEIRDGKTVITSRRAQLIEAINRATLWDSVLIHTPEVVVRADSVVYDFHLKRCFLFAYPSRQVVIEDESVLVFAPMLEYSLTQSVVLAPMGVEATGKSNSYVVTGKSGSFDLQKRLGVIDYEPVMRLVGGTGDSNVVITARRSRYFIADGLIIGEGDVKVQSGKGSLRCDTAVFFVERDSGVAWGNPVVEDRSGFARGDSMFFLFKSRELSRVKVAGRTEGSYRTDDGDTVQIAGFSLTIELEEGKIAAIAVEELISGRLIRSGGTLTGPPANDKR